MQDQETTAAGATAPQTARVKRKPGPKPKFGVAMTATERSRVWRQNNVVRMIRVTPETALALRQRRRDTGQSIADILASTVLERA